jgi:DNA-binding MarR family transcriptional regulator
MDRRKAAQEFFQEIDTLRRLGAARIERGGSLPTPARMAVLCVIAERGPSGIKAIAEKFGMTSSAVTQLVNGLVDDGLLARAGDAGDKRKTILEMTAAGRAALTKIHRAREKLAGTMFEALTDSELDSLRVIHRKMIDHLQRLWTTPPPTQK